MESGMGLDGGQSIVHPPNPANPAQPRWGHTSWCSFSKAMNWHNWGHFFTPTRDSASHFCTQCSLNRLKMWSWWKSSSPEIPGISKASTCLDKWGLKAKDWNKGQTKKNHWKTDGDSSKKSFFCSSPPARAALRVWSECPGSPPRFLPEVFCCSHIRRISRGSVSTSAAPEYSTGQSSLTCSCPQQNILRVNPYFPA